MFHKSTEKLDIACMKFIEEQTNLIKHSWDLRK